MGWPSFLTPWWGLLGALAVPLVLLYVLRQKRPDLAVSSTILWSKTLADLRASTPWQRLRRNLLLLLQLLILAALVVTHMRPVVQGQAVSTVAGVIVIDATASMQTTDGGGSSRLERAKAEAHKLVEGMQRGDRFMLLADGGGMVQVRSGFTESKPELHQLIDRVKASDTTTDLSETLLLGATSLRAIGNSADTKDTALKAGNIWLFSDGVGVRLPNVAGLERLVEHVKIGESRNNVGIVRLAVTPVPKAERTYQVFVGLINTGDQERTVRVGLAYQTPDKFVDVKRVVVPAGRGAKGEAIEGGGQAAAIFQVTLDPGRIYVQLDGKDDDFALDNTAYGLLEPPRKLKVVLVSPRKNAVLERFLQVAAATGLEGGVEGQLLVPAAYKAEVAADLAIFDTWTPEQMPKCDALVIRPTSSAGASGIKVLGQLEQPIPILRWRRDDPVLSYVELGEVRVARAVWLERDPEARELISTVSGPLLAVKDVGSSRRYVLGFDPLTESNWYRDPSLLMFLQNVLSEARVRHFIGRPQVLATGEAARLWDLGPEATVVLPDGSGVVLETRAGAAEFAATDRVGFYDVVSAGKKGTFAVNLLSATASAIEPRSLETRGGGVVAEAGSVASVNREIWQWVALAGLGVLMVEWWVYHRRIA